MQEPKNSYPFTRNFVQFGYVTDDIDAAIARLSASCGVSQWRRAEGVRLRIQANTHCTINVALAYVGPTMIELIQPVDGDMSLYGPALANAEGRGAIKLHHLGYAVPSEREWQRMTQTVEAHRLRVTKVDDPDLPLRTLHVDFGYGYHNEYLLFDEAGLKLFASVPQNDGEPFVNALPPNS